MQQSVCSEMGCSREAVQAGMCQRDYMRMWRAERRTKAPPMKLCAECGEEFEVSQSHKLYCTESCGRESSLRRRRDREYRPPVLYCAWCSKQIPYKSGKRAYCSGECQLAHAAKTARWRKKRLPADFEPPKKCELCGRGARRLVIDHDHSCCAGERTCGECFRGMLCQSCNVGLGMFDDDPAALRKAARYVERTRSVRLTGQLRLIV
jgi:Recombination endonuclease VII.